MENAALEKEEGLKSHRVHFPQDADQFGHDSDIGINCVNDELINVHLGFLQIRHRYEITFTFNCPNSFVDDLVVRNQEPPNLNIHVVDLRKVNDETETSTNKYKIVLELFAHKEKLLKEQIQLQSSQNPTKTLTLMFNARVLGKGKGTPLLKDGIKRIGVEMEEESEASDWQGFD